MLTGEVWIARRRLNTAASRAPGRRGSGIIAVWFLPSDITSDAVMHRRCSATLGERLRHRITTERIAAARNDDACATHRPNTMHHSDKKERDDHARVPLAAGAPQGVVALALPRPAQRCREGIGLMRRERSGEGRDRSGSNRPGCQTGATSDGRIRRRRSNACAPP